MHDPVPTSSSGTYGTAQPQTIPTVISSFPLYPRTLTTAQPWYYTPASPYAPIDSYGAAYPYYQYPVHPVYPAGAQSGAASAAAAFPGFPLQAQFPTVPTPIPPFVFPPPVVAPGQDLRPVATRPLGGQDGLTPNTVPTVIPLPILLV